MKQKNYRTKSQECHWFLNLILLQGNFFTLFVWNNCILKLYPDLIISIWDKWLFKIQCHFYLDGDLFRNGFSTEFETPNHFNHPLQKIGIFNFFSRIEHDLPSPTIPYWRLKGQVRWPRGGRLKRCRKWRDASWHRTLSRSLQTLAKMSWNGFQIFKNHQNIIFSYYGLVLLCLF